MPTNSTRRPTLKDVARIAAVDISVVSRVISKDPGLSIQPSTRQRVLQAIEQINYRPSVAGRGLKTQRLSTVGVVVRDMTSPFDGVILSLINQRASRAGYAVLLADDLERPRSSQEIASLLAEDRVDGLLVLSGKSDKALRRALDPIAKPIVVVDRRLSGFVTVTADDTRAARMGTDYLASLGHRRIAHLAGPPGVEQAERRQEGFWRAMEMLEDDGDSLVVHAEDFTPRAGYEATKELLARRAGHTAVLADNANLALGLYRAAYEEGLRIPDDLSVIAIHESQLAELFVPSLSTVSLPLAELAERGLGLLVDLIEGRPAESIEVDQAPVLHSRESVQPLPSRR